VGMIALGYSTISGSFDMHSEYTDAQSVVNERV